MSVKPELSPEVTEIIRRWLQKGKNDLAAVARLLGTADDYTEGPYDVACYHCEQAAEHFLKALLTYHGIQAPLVHDIDFYHNALPPDRRLPLPPSLLNHLSTYGTDPWWEPTAEHTMRAYEIARRIGEAVRDALPRELVTA